jgi:carboxypeptidase Taq
MNPNSPLQDLYKQCQQIYHLKALSGLASWDQETFMPSGAGAARAEMASTIETEIHRRYTESRLYDQVLQAQSSSQLDPSEKAFLREFKKDIEKYTLIPSSLASEIGYQNSMSQQIWAHVRQGKAPRSEFDHSLKAIISLKKLEADCLKTASQSPYEALLQQYEPDFKLSEFNQFFDEIIPTIQNLVASHSTSSQQISSGIEQLSAAQQKELSRLIIQKMGFDFEHGRLDPSEHPFTMGLNPFDVRLTERNRNHHPLEFIYTNLHEGGHGLYEQGLPQKWAFTPIAEARSLGLHESQSRLWENNVGRSRGFMEWISKEIKDLYSLEIHTEQLWQEANTIQPSFIRVDADEVTYNLHVYLRFQIEQMLFSGQIETSQIHEVWNEEFSKLFNLKIEDASFGYLQDVHWSCGLFGYFPTYTLGNLIAAQLFNQFESSHSHWNQELAKGNWDTLTHWLKTHIHQHGRSKSSPQILQETTSANLNSKFFTGYLTHKFA